MDEPIGFFEASIFKRNGKLCCSEYTDQIERNKPGTQEAMDILFKCKQAFMKEFKRQIKNTRGKMRKIKGYQIARAKEVVL